MAGEIASGGRVEFDDERTVADLFQSARAMKMLGRFSVSADREQRTGYNAHGALRLGQPCSIDFGKE